MKITKITKTNKFDHTWDIEVPEVHAYSIRTNSSEIICHNSSITQCSTNGIEPIRSLLTEKSAKNGKKKVLVPYFPKHKSEYVLAFDIQSNEPLIKVAAAMQRWFDMGISFNTYLNYQHYPDGKIPISVVIKDILMSHKYGLKTMYYNNTPDDNEEGNIKGNCASGACSI